MARIRGEDQPGFLDVVESWLVHQPWFPAPRGRWTLGRVGGLRLPRSVGDADPQLTLEMHIFDVAHYGTGPQGPPVRVAVPVALRGRPSAQAGKEAFIGRLTAKQDEEIWVYDGARDPAFLAAWLEMARRGQGSRNGRSHGEAFAGFDQWGPFTAPLRRTAEDVADRPVTRTRVTVGSDASDAADESVRSDVLVEFDRRPSAQRSFAVETALTLTHAQARSISPVLGLISGAWVASGGEASADPAPQWESGDLCVIRGVGPDHLDGLTEVQAAVRHGQGIAELAAGMGRSLGRFHADLAGAFGAHPQTSEQLRTMRADAAEDLPHQWEAVQGRIPEEDRTQLDSMVADTVRELKKAEEPLMLQRIHGDLHLEDIHRAEPHGERWMVLEADALLDHAVPSEDVVSLLIDLAQHVTQSSADSMDGLGVEQVSADDHRDGGEIDAADHQSLDVPSERQLRQPWEQAVEAFLQHYRDSDAGRADVDSVFFRWAMMRDALRAMERGTLGAVSVADLLRRTQP